MLKFPIYLFIKKVQKIKVLCTYVFYFLFRNYLTVCTALKFRNRKITDVEEISYCFRRYWSHDGPYMYAKFC